MIFLADDYAHLKALVAKTFNSSTKHIKKQNMIILRTYVAKFSRRVMIRRNVFGIGYVIITFDNFTLCERIKFVSLDWQINTFGLLRICHL